jgi:hypothetical protein
VTIAKAVLPSEAIGKQIFICVESKKGFCTVLLALPAGETNLDSGELGEVGGGAVDPVHGRVDRYHPAVAVLLELRIPEDAPAKISIHKACNEGPLPVGNIDRIEGMV